MINDDALKLCLQLNLYSELRCVTFSQINVNIYLYWDILKSLPGIFLQHYSLFAGSVLITSELN